MDFYVNDFFYNSYFYVWFDRAEKLRGGAGMVFTPPPTPPLYHPPVGWGV